MKSKLDFLISHTFVDVVILVINIITRIQFNFVNGLERLAPKKDLNIMKKNFYSMNHKQHPTDFLLFSNKFKIEE